MMTIETFAILKDYFEPKFQISETPTNINQLQEHLLRLNPRAATLLSMSRFAVNDTFIDQHYQLQANDVISIIPPSSGG